MDIVLGVSMTPTTVRMVLVEGEKADGVDRRPRRLRRHRRRRLGNVCGRRQVVEAVLGTQESAAAGGHHLKAIGVTWSDHAEGAALRDALAARGIDDVMLVSDGHAAAALAQAVGRAVGYDTTALFFIDRDTATLSVVQTDDGSVVKVLSRTPAQRRRDGRADRDGRRGRRTGCRRHRPCSWSAPGSTSAR